jgi:hypothetical protein
LYHHLPATERSAAGVDIFFAFNSGIHYYESWAPTLQVWAGGTAPLVVTAWAVAEAIVVRQKLLDMGGVPHKDLHGNPHGSLLPNPVVDDHGVCNFDNRFVAILRPNGAATAAPGANRRKKNNKKKKKTSNQMKLETITLETID